MTTVQFLSDWSNQQSEEIRPGESLRLEYDPARLPQCRAERYGRKAWSLNAYVRFQPGGPVQASDVSSGSCEIKVPADASQLELWFHNTDHTGGSAWDSQYGQNYWLAAARK